jgi:hypothetical protein
MKVEKIKDVSMIDQFDAVFGMIKALGYDVEQITLLDVAKVKYDIEQSINDLTAWQATCEQHFD